jgi:3-deoxy-D-manno-octulosonate 8-phosphate phosphatase (KDO 8-P phosphatase)
MAMIAGNNMIDDLWCGTAPDKQTIQRASLVKLFLMDVDGVLTDGKVYYLPGPDGKAYESKSFYCHDGLGFNFLNDVGIETGFISGRDAASVKEYAANKKVKYVYQGHLEKVAIYESILADSKLSESQIAYIGDDLTDIPLLRRAGLACTVANARPEVIPYAHFVTQVNGGYGAVRETIELILKAQNKWQSILKKYGAAE